MQGLLPLSDEDDPVNALRGADPVRFQLVRSTQSKTVTVMMPCYWHVKTTADVVAGEAVFRNYESWHTLLGISGSMVDLEEKVVGFSIGYHNDKELLLTPRNCLTLLYEYRPTVVLVKIKNNWVGKSAFLIVSFLLMIAIASAKLLKPASIIGSFAL